MIVLGINEAHNASAALAIDGEIIAACQEERFTRLKNQPGLPFLSIKFCLDFAKIKPDQVNCVVFTGNVPNYITTLNRLNKPQQTNIIRAGQKLHYMFRALLLNTEYHFPALRGIDEATVEPVIKLSQKIFYPKTAKILEKQLGIPAERHLYLDHHTAHAYSGLFSSPFPSLGKDVLVFTCDAGGDRLSSTISTYKKGRFKRLLVSSQYDSLGCLYGVITDILGMNPLEHEYKVMGLAPYAEEHGTQIVYEFLKSVVSLNTQTLRWKTIVSSDNLNRYVRQHLPRARFDHIAGAIQRLTEELLCQWIQLAIHKFGIHNIIFSGGVAQNVKANQKIAALPNVKDFFAMPSAGDESNSIGAAYWASKKINPKIQLKPLKNLYLGPSFSQKEVLKEVNKLKSKKYKITQIKNQSKIASLIASGEIVARFWGRMEFGARALGNRSILADPQLPEVTTIINRQIKSRDFWMPFAPTILEEDAPRYLINPKRVAAPFMTIAFDTQAKFRKDLWGAIHPFDYTCRPQILAKEDNPAYYQLIKNFKNITGRSAILNTSFNLHGDPIVCSPHDAVKTFEVSGLKHLATEDYLISKEE